MSSATFKVIHFLGFFFEHFCRTRRETAVLLLSGVKSDTTICLSNCDTDFIRQDWNLSNISFDFWPKKRYVGNMHVQLHHRTLRIHSVTEITTNNTTDSLCHTHYLINVTQPLGDIVKCLGTCNVINKHYAHGTTVVWCRDGVEAFLPSSVPTSSVDSSQNSPLTSSHHDNNNNNNNRCSSHSYVKCAWQLTHTHVHVHTHWLSFSWQMFQHCDISASRLQHSHNKELY